MTTYLSPNFSLEELTQSQTAARNGWSNKPSAAVLANLTKTAQKMEQVRAVLGVVVMVNSGYRSVRVNKAVGGTEHSAHCKGYAVDFIAPRYGTPLAICHALVKSGIKFDQIIEEGTWVHISFDPRMRQKITTMRGGKYSNGLRRMPK